MEAPQARAVKQAVVPVEQEIGGDDVDHDLRPERQARERPAAELEIVGDMSSAVMTPDSSAAPAIIRLMRI